MVASVLLIIGIVGSLFNFKTLYSDKEMKEEKKLSIQYLIR